MVPDDLLLAPPPLPALLHVPPALVPGPELAGPHLRGRGLGVRVGGEPRAPLRRDHRLALPQQEGPRGPPRDVAAAVRSHLDTSSAQLSVQSFIYFGKLGNEIFDIDIIFSYRRITFYICHISRMHFCRKLHSVK